MFLTKPGVLSTASLQYYLEKKTRTERGISGLPIFYPTLDQALLNTSVIWESYQATMRKAGGSTQMPVHHWKINWGSTWIYSYQRKMESRWNSGAA